MSAPIASETDSVGGGFLDAVAVAVVGVAVGRKAEGGLNKTTCDVEDDRKNADHAAVHSRGTRSGNTQ